MTEIPSTTTAIPAPLPGVPAWRVGKPDAFLATDVDTARDAVLTIADGAFIGKHLGARSEGVRCVSHLFESLQPGYAGWVWFASLSRIARGKYSTVNEVGMLPTESSVLAPPWVPWSDRVRPEDRQEEEEAAAALAAAHGPAGHGHAEHGSDTHSEHGGSEDGASEDTED
ncbi:DUF3027 domain-containing protein [Arthrobacter psychrochitiniphilus]|uniref:DUF3027 domain-containing protein n=1 Tax=Arthrobacter psychrochitiniphilus TaxID=291045 RepID=UPI003F7C4F2F